MPATLRRIYIAIDPDPAGLKAAKALIARSRSKGVHAVPLMPAGEDFNADLMHHGIEAVRRRLTEQLLAVDLERLIEKAAGVAENDAIETFFEGAIP